MTNRVLLGTRKGVFSVEKQKNGKWDIARVWFLGDNCTNLLPDPHDEGHIYVTLGHGHFGVKMHRSTDNGESWTEIAAPTYPKMPEGRAPDINPFDQKPIPWSLEMVWSLVHGNPNSKGHLWCGTIPGGLFESHDAGQTWQINEPLWNHPTRSTWFPGGIGLPGISSVCVSAKDPNHISLGISTAGVWLTKDGGKSWNIGGKGLRAEYCPPDQAYEPQGQDVHCLAQCAADPNAMWVQHHNGVFRSTDGAASWTELHPKPSAFGFPVVAHPKESGTAWFVPGVKDEKRYPPEGKVVVTRTRDGGKTFDVLSRGLPQQHAYDLVYRHALHIDPTGSKLAFGSTTGSVWVSDDQGDNWQTVSTNLPPVYCVRFG
jgi:hypothetical protein